MYKEDVDKDLLQACIGVDVAVCPICGGKTRVYRSDTNEYWAVRRRHRECSNCKYTFSTIEIPASTNAYGENYYIRTKLDRARRQAALEERKRLMGIIADLSKSLCQEEPSHHRDIILNVYKAISDSVDKEAKE